MRLHCYEWGENAASAIVCVHGATGHAERFRQLAEERWARRFHVVAMDLRGHGRSAWDPPWTIEAHVDDLIETVDALRLTGVDWVGHSFGGRLVIELAVRRPDLVRRAVLLDPAIHFSGEQADAAVAAESREPIWDSADECLASRDDAAGADEARALADLRLQLEELPDGRLRRRTSHEAMQAIFRQLVREPPSPDVVPVPTVLLYAPEYGLVSQEQAQAYGRGGVVTVSGGHMVMWSAFDQVAETVASAFGHE